MGSCIIRSVSDTIVAMLFIPKRHKNRRVPPMAHGPQFDKHYFKLCQVYEALQIREPRYFFIILTEIKIK
jgi:hypothetical protein